MPLGYHLSTYEDVDGACCLKVFQYLHKGAFSGCCIPIHSGYPGFRKNIPDLCLYPFCAKAKQLDLRIATGLAAARLSPCVTAVVAFVRIGLLVERHGNLAVFATHRRPAADTSGIIGKAAPV